MSRILNFLQPRPPVNHQAAPPASNRQRPIGQIEPKKKKDCAMKEAVQVRNVRFSFYIFLQNFVSDLQASERAGADILRRNRGAACDRFPSGSQDRLSESLSNGKHTSAEGCEVIWAGYLAAGGR